MGVSSSPSPLVAAGRPALAALKAKVQAIEEAGRLAAGPGVSLGAEPLVRIERAALHEVAAQAHFDEPAACAFLMAIAARALAERPGALVWVRARGGCEFGAPYGPGLAGFGLAPERCIFVTPAKPAQALPAAEEAARTPGLSAVIAEPGAGVDLVAGRRLQLAAESVCGLVLLRRPTGADPAAAARTRWRVTARPSFAPEWASSSPRGAPAPLGRPAWRVTLERARGGFPKTFDVEWRHETGELHLAPVLVDRAGEALRRSA